MKEKDVSREELRQMIIDYAKPLELEALVESGVLKKVRAWYQILDRDRLPKRVADHITEIKQGKDGITLVKIRPVRVSDLKLAAKVSNR